MEGDGSALFDDAFMSHLQSTIREVEGAVGLRLGLEEGRDGTAGASQHGELRSPDSHDGTAEFSASLHSQPTLEWTGGTASHASRFATEAAASAGHWPTPAAQASAAPRASSASSHRQPSFGDSATAESLEELRRRVEAAERESDQVLDLLQRDADVRRPCLAALPQRHVLACPENEGVVT